MNLKSNHGFVQIFEAYPRAWLVVLFGSLACSFVFWSSFLNDSHLPTWLTPLQYLFAFVMVGSGPFLLLLLSDYQSLVSEYEEQCERANAMANYYRDKLGNGTSHLE